MAQNYTKAWIYPFSPYNDALDGEIVIDDKGNECSHLRHKSTL